MVTTIQNPKAYRLPTHTLPRRYDIELDARVGKPDFSGKVTITLDIQEPTDTIELHQLELDITRATLTAGGDTLEGDVSTDNEREMAEIKFNRPLPTGEAALELAFSGHISPMMEGLYLAKDGPEQCLCTQCEETDARRIFPCWDEPTFKAQFAWTITTDVEMTVLANGPLESSEDTGDGKSKTWRFAPTKPMSSYLCALVIGDMAGTPVEEVGGTPISVWALRGKEHMGEFAHNYTKRLLPWYEEYFDAPYHYDKYDQAAVPGFAAGAMENSGLVLYRQSALIMNPQTASWTAEKRIAHVVAHETAHMWFGNLVTMKWWDDLWLNEAFAEWVSHKALASLSPDYEIWNDFQGGKNSALAADALESTHPIYSPVETPAQATELFDAITYEKGCSVMRMLENFLGEEPFRSGLRTYMKEFAEANAAGSDLWNHLQQASGEPVSDIMGSWIKQGGYPVVSVRQEGATLHLAQQRFFSSPGGSQGNTQLWHVPVVIRYEDASGIKEQRVLLTEPEGTVNLEAEGDVKWLYANLDEIGFYRQNLDPAILKNILANLSRLTPLEQMGLLGDQYALVRNGTVRMTQFLDVLSALLSSDHYSVVSSVVGRLHTVETRLEEAGDEAALAKFRAWVGDAFRGKLSALGFEPREGESQNDAQSRVSVIDAMASLAQDEEAIRQVNRWADREAQDPSSVDPNLAGLFVSVAARFGDDARFSRYLEIYNSRRGSAASPQEANRYLNSFAAFEKSSLVDRAVGLLSEGVIPQESTGVVLRQMLPQRHTQMQAWSFMKGNWPTIRNLGDMWTGFLVEATGQLPATSRADMVGFYDENLKGVAEMSYARALETLDQLEEFKTRTRGELVGWFEKL